ncbi:hypothetical protein BU15DRAFT_69495, partial [Melanogaster broomeanus]
DALIAISKQGEEHGTLLKGAIDSDELQKMYDWMDAVNCTTKYEITLGQRQDETCKWLLDLKRYSDWRSSQNAFLRVCGKPGAGKSVLISAVIDSLSKTEIKGGALAYFYCDFRTDRTTHACEVIRSLVTQLLVKSNKDWLPLFPDLVKRKSNREPPPVDLKILYPLLLEALRLHDRPVLVIDALDECNDYVKLTELLAHLHNEASCRVFCTSRPLQDAPKTFNDLPTIDLHHMSDETLCDMKLHIEKEVAKYDKLASLRDEIVPSLLKKADGMFRWVQCQLDRLSGCRAKSNIQEVLATLPSGLYETYDKILSDINRKEFDRQIAKSILLWLVGALMPLSLNLLVEAVTFDIQRSDTFRGFEFLSNDDVLDVCGSLVSYDKKSDRVSLSHFSVKEYLFDEHLRNGALSRYHLSSPIADIHLAKLCIDYFSTPQMIPRCQIYSLHWGNLKSVGDLTPLAQYTGNFFGRQHFRRVVETEEPLHELMQSLLTLRNAFHAHSMEPDMALNIIVSWGSPCFLKTYLNYPQTIRLTDIPDGNSPLGYAIAHDQLCLCGGPSELGLRYQPPMSQMGRSTNIIHLAITSFQHRIYYFLGSRRRRESPDYVICSLLKYGANATVLTTRGDSPLHAWLCKKTRDGKERHSVAKVLVNAGCDPKSKNAAGVTPLHVALYHRDETLVDYFHGQGALFEDCRYIHLVDISWANGLSWYDAAATAVDAAKHAVGVARSIRLAD